MTLRDKTRRINPQIESQLLEGMVLKLTPERAPTFGFRHGLLAALHRPDLGVQVTGLGRSEPVARDAAGRDQQMGVNIDIAIVGRVDVELYGDTFRDEMLVGELLAHLPPKLDSDLRIAREGQQKLARFLRIFAPLHRLSLVPQDRCVEEALSRTLGQQDLVVEQAVAMGKEEAFARSLTTYVGAGVIGG